MNAATPERRPATEQISGLIERVTFHNDESGFCVLRVKVSGRRDDVTVVGSLPSVTAGANLTTLGDNGHRCLWGRYVKLNTMNSKLVEAIGLKTHAVALTWADAAPQGAMQFKPGRWGCVVSLIAAVATKGRVGAFDRQTYGCWGGGIGLGFGNCYESFPSGIEGFCHFLADGNDKSEQGRRAGEQVEAWGDRHFADDFLHGERYLKSADVTSRFLESMPMRDIPAQYVLVKPLGLCDPESEDIKSVTLFVDPEQLSVLVVLANYTEPDLENVAVPWGAACQIMGIFAYRELERAHPRALVGMTDLSARQNVRASLGRNVLSFTVPWPLFLKMEQNVEGSFFQRRTWQELRSRS